QREFLRESHPPSAPLPTPENPVPPAAEASSPALSEILRRAKPYEQIVRSERALRSLFPPNGKTPAALSAFDGANKINKWLTDEKRDDKAPDSEAGCPPVSDDVAGKVMNNLGRT